MRLGTQTQLLEEHRSAVASLLAAARAVPSAQWNVPLGDAKWSPAQVAEHIRLSYLVLTTELNGGSGLRIRTNWLQRTIARVKFLGGILEAGTIPTGARAPREAKPGPGPFDREPTLLAIENLAQGFEAALGHQWDAKKPVATHHIFGRLGAAELLRFAAVHTLHHAAQLK